MIEAEYWEEGGKQSIFSDWEVKEKEGGEVFRTFILSLSPTALLKIPPAQFKLLMDSIVWAFKHTMRNVAEIGLNVLLLLLQKFAADQVGTQFFQTYFIDLMQHIFSVVTDSSHTASTFILTTILLLIYVHTYCLRSCKFRDFLLGAPILATIWHVIL